MKFLTGLIIVSLAAAAISNQNPGETPPQSQQRSLQAEVDLELTQTSNSYRAGNFAEAQQHAERAVSLDPTNKTAATFLARVMHQRYKPGEDTPENLQFALGAIAAYQKLLALDYQNEEAYKAIAVLYASTHQEELLKAWLMQRAVDPLFSNQKRAEAYAVLAGKYWDCSFKFTELPDQKVTEMRGRTAVIVYRMPKDRAQFERANACVTKGCEMADMALSLDRGSETAWSYKTNLLFEAAKLAQMQGLDLMKTKYESEAKEASVQVNRLAEKRRLAEEAGEPEPNARPSPSPEWLP